MKTMKKLFAVLLAVVMTLGMMTTVFAADDGKITIDNAITGKDYTIYQILDLESYSGSNYVYKLNGTSWDNFIKAQTTYVSVDDQNYVTWVDGADEVAFAKAALAYAQANSIVGTTKTADSTTVEFTGLALGYYLLDSSTGALCSLDTTDKEVVIKEKNEEPGVEKKVKEDSTGEFGDNNDASIGDSVEYETTITAKEGAQNYVLHDTMSAGLTYTGVTSVKLNGTDVAAANYTVNAAPADGCTFEVTFTQAFCDTLKDNDKIVVAYGATVNANAVIAPSANTNETKLTYGDKHETESDTTETYVCEFNVLKFTKADDGTEVALANAKFTLTDADGNLVKMTEVATNEYKVATDGTVTEITTDSTGKFKISGLDAGTYTLTETEAPAGYNKLKAPITVTIERVTTTSGTTVTVKNNGTAVENATVKVENNSGSELPSTGGIGTTIMYVIGAILVIGAGVMLITKRRMVNE